MQGDGEEEGGLLAVGEQRLSGVAAEIGQGQSLGALLADLAQLPGIGLLAVAQDDDARRRGDGGLGECGQEKRKDEADQHGADPSRSVPSSPVTSG